MEGTTQIAAHRSVARSASFRRRRRTSWVDRNFARLAVLPTTTLMLLVFGIPLLFSAWLSLEGWTPDQTLFGGKFAGTANYEDLLTDPEFTGTLVLTLG
jgi:multiple sugar transport system permease protein